MTGAGAARTRGVAHEPLGPRTVAAVTHAGTGAGAIGALLFATRAAAA